MNNNLIINNDPESVLDRLYYEKPSFQRIELAIDETLSSGCKLGSNSACVGPPTIAFEGGS